MDELSKKRIENLKSKNPEIFELYEYVILSSLDKEWCNSPNIVSPEIAKSIVYETLKLVAEWFDADRPFTPTS